MRQTNAALVLTWWRRSSDGQIVEIEPYDDRLEAEAALAPA